MVFLNQDFALLDTKAGEREHTDLVGDVVPGSWGVDSLQLFSEQISHLDNSAGDVISKFGLPGVKVVLIVEDSLDD